VHSQSPYPLVTAASRDQEQRCKKFGIATVINPAYASTITGSDQSYEQAPVTERCSRSRLIEE
jgi:hypothetical protein